MYGQRSAPRAWYSTVSEWLVDEMGYKQGRNEPCVFRHPETDHRIVLFCDDFLCRGSRTVSEQFYAALADKFDCKDPTYLELGESLTFTGTEISMHSEGQTRYYSMRQYSDMMEFLVSKGLESEKVRQNPMADRKVLVDEGEIGENMKSWCRSVIGGLQYYARGTRWDIAYAVSRVSQTLANPTRGTVKAIEHIAG